VGIAVTEIVIESPAAAPRQLFSATLLLLLEDLQVRTCKAE